jgi:hypothetical protein
MEHASYLFLLMLTEFLFIVVRWVHLTSHGMMFGNILCYSHRLCQYPFSCGWNLRFGLTAQKPGEPRLFINNTNG